MDLLLKGTQEWKNPYPDEDFIHEFEYKIWEIGLPLQPSKAIQWRLYRERT